MNVRVAVESGQHQHARVGMPGPYFGGGPNTVLHRHPQIHEHEVGSVLVEGLYGLGAIDGFADHFEVGFRVDQGCEAHSHDEMVVGHEDSDFNSVFHKTASEAAKSGEGVF